MAASVASSVAAWDIANCSPTPADYAGRHVSLKEVPVEAYLQEEVILHKGTGTAHELNHY